MKNNRWILGLVIIVILIAGFLVQDFRNSKKKSNMPKQEVAGAEDYQKIISKDDAVQIVKNLPEVKQFLSGISARIIPGITSDLIAEFDSEGVDYYSIHVYELVHDKVNNESHTATFNWYKVNKYTGKIKCSFTIYKNEKDSNGIYEVERVTDPDECY